MFNNSYPYQPILDFSDNDQKNCYTNHGITDMLVTHSVGGIFKFIWCFQAKQEFYSDDSERV